MDIYGKNLEALKKTHPHLVQMVEDARIDEEDMVVSKSSSGELRVTYKRKDGKEITINDSRDLSGMPEPAANMIDQEDGTRIILLLGFGLGGYPDVLHARLKGDGILVVYEAIPSLLKIAFQQQDLSLLLSSDRLILILGEDSMDFSFAGKYRKDIIMGNVYVMQQTACVALKEEAYEKFRVKMREEKGLIYTNLITGVGRGAEWTDAFIDNIPTILRSAGVTRLRGLFEGRPAIIVSAGPSLERNFHLLKEAKGRAIIIAVDVVLPTLLPAEIVPDFVVAIEANRKLFLAFKDNPLLKSVPLVCAGEVSRDTMTSLYPGPVFLNLRPRASVNMWLSRFWEKKGFIPQFGGSVAHTAFALAEYLGANPIALIGQDLSFQYKLHAGDVTGLFYSDEEIEGFKSKNPVVTDIFGEKRHTTAQFLTFRTAFEKRIKGNTVKVVNATEGGLPIEGAESMRLKDFVGEYCNVPAIDTLEILESLGRVPTKYDLPGLLSEIEASSLKLWKICNKAKKIVECVLRLKDLKKEDALGTEESVRLIGRIGRLEKKVEDPIVRVLDPYRSRMENYFRSDKIDDNNLDGLQESLDYYGHLIAAIDHFLAKISRLIISLTREQEVDQVMNDTTIPAIERYHKTGMIHGAGGLSREAVKELEMAATEFSNLSDESQRKYWPCALQTYSELAGLYLKQHRFYEAKGILEVLSVLTSGNGTCENHGMMNRDAIKTHMDACCEGISSWENKKAKMQVLLKKAESAYGSHLEAGSFYLKVSDLGRAERAYKKAIVEAGSLISDHQEDRTLVSVQTMRLVGAYYGLAQTYLEMERHGDAVASLDSGRQQLEKLCDLDHEGIMEDFGTLFVDLYLRIGERERAISVCEQVVTVLPQGTKLRNRMQTLRHEHMSQALEAHG